MTRRELEDLTRFLGETPGVVAEALSGLHQADVRWKPGAEAFSMLENICHLRDVEEEGYRVRVERILREDDPFLADLDGGKLARERRYNEQDPEAALQAFARAREATLRIARGATPEELQRGASFENVGRVTLGRLLEMMREHDQGHRAELGELRRLLSSKGR